jgi:hypothetical protein
MSNNTPKNGDAGETLLGQTNSLDEYCIYFGTSAALTFASQLTKVETLKVESTFGTVMRGLQVFGHQIVKPEALGQIIAVPV